MIALLLITIWLMYRLLFFSLRRIFAYEFKHYTTFEKISLNFLKEPKNNRIFFIDMPHSSIEDTLSAYLKYLDGKNLQYTFFSLSQIHSPALKQKIDEDIRHRDIIVVKDFGYRANDHKTWQLKLSLLEDLCAQKDKQIIIASEIQPPVVIKFYEIMISKIYDLQRDAQFRAEYQEYRHSKTQWNQFFSAFVKMYEPIQKTNLDFEDVPTSIKKTLNDELSYGLFLSKLKPVLTEYLIKLENNAGIEEEDIILKIQNLAEPYYYAIWSSLSKEEKFLLFDLAIDGFVNAKNSNVVRMLLQKGLLIYQDNLKLMNRSFNNFVLNAVDRKMDHAMRKEMLKSGAWSTLQVALVLVLIAMSAFIILGQKQILDNFQAAITALLAGAGLLIRFTGLWGSLGIQEGQTIIK